MILSHQLYIRSPISSLQPRPQPGTLGGEVLIDTDFDTITGIFDRFFTAACLATPERLYTAFMYPEIIQTLVQRGVTHRKPAMAAGFDLTSIGVIVQAAGQLGLGDLVTVPVSKREEFQRLRDKKGRLAGAEGRPAAPRLTPPLQPIPTLHPAPARASEYPLVKFHQLFAQG